MDKKKTEVVSAELEPTNGRKSFYRKAHILDDMKGTRYLKSYDTVMCSVDKAGRVKRYSDYRSATTGAHLRSFFCTFCPNVDTKRFYGMPVSETPDLVQRV